MTYILRAANMAIWNTHGLVATNDVVTMPLVTLDAMLDAARGASGVPDKIARIKEHRAQFGSSLAGAKDAVENGWRSDQGEPKPVAWRVRAATDGPSPWYYFDTREAADRFGEPDAAPEPLYARPVP